MIKIGKTYWVQNIVCMPIEVTVLEINPNKKGVRIKQGWINISQLHEKYEDCPCR